MPLEINQVHQTARVKDPQTGAVQLRLVKVIPYTRIRVEGFPPVYLQSGVVYSEDGKRIKFDDVPSFIKDQIMALDRDYLINQLGFKNLFGEAEEEESDPSNGRTSAKRRRP